MEISRRHFCAIAGGSALVAPGVASAAWPLTSLPFGQSAARTSPFVAAGATASDASFATYSSTLVGGFTPSQLGWGGRTWKADMGSTWTANLDYSCRVTATKIRFELHSTTFDRAVNDPVDKRRTELHDKTSLPNGVAMWGAFSVNNHAWADPAGMTATTGGAMCQMHMPSGGSPAFAFRRDKNGNFLVTTNGANDPINNNKRYVGPLSFGAVHDIVYRCVIHPVNGELDVWVDGRQVLTLRGASIGQTNPGCYWCLGLYFAGGTTCPIVAEYSNHVAPTTNYLLARISSPPSWPAV